MWSAVCFCLLAALGAASSLRLPLIDTADVEAARRQGNADAIASASGLARAMLPERIATRHALFVGTPSPPSPSPSPPPSNGVDSPPSDLDRQVTDAVNAFRCANAAAATAVPSSKSLTTVAKLHIADLCNATAEDLPSECNAHSWFSVPGRCCFNGSAAGGPCMWNKPAQLTAYSSAGFEIFASGVLDPKKPNIADIAVAVWASSAPHKAVILNLAPWDSQQWQAIGCSATAIPYTQGRKTTTYWLASCWFGFQRDTFGH